MNRTYEFEKMVEFARSNGVDIDREIAIENLLKGRLETFMEELSTDDVQVVFNLMDKVLDKGEKL
jgi:hypothetical protein|tara:strand:- start:1590 stop:1784 length:195 start_codon:yes stop_codon:yes gene_type:complete